MGGLSSAILCFMGEEKAVSLTLGHLWERSPEAEFTILLSGTILRVEHDPAQLRNLVYELARVKLQRECLLACPRWTARETRRALLALETAVERVETASSQVDSLQVASIDGFGTALSHTIEHMENDSAQLR